MRLVKVVMSKPYTTQCMHALRKSYLDFIRLKMMKRPRKFVSCRLRKAYSAFMRISTKGSSTAHGVRVHRTIQSMLVFMLVALKSTLLMQEYKAVTMTVYGISLN